jgi:hypothetical protein
MKVIEYPKRVNPFNVRTVPLLPVNPPKVHSFCFMFMVDNIEIGIHEFAICTIKVDV